LFFNFCHKNLLIFALPSSAVLKPAQAGLVYLPQCFVKQSLTVSFFFQNKVTSQHSKSNLIFEAELN